MYDTFVSPDEPLLMKQLYYRAYHKHIRLTKPSKLELLYLDRNGTRRGLENRDEIVQYLMNHTDITLTIQPDTQLSFQEQVEFVLDKDIYLSIHGAAMTHILFMEPFGAIIEINPPNFKEPYYRNMAEKTRLVFYGIYNTVTKDMKRSMALKETDKKLNQRLTVPMELFERTVSMAVTNVWLLKYKEVDL